MRLLVFLLIIVIILSFMSGCIGTNKVLSSKYIIRELKNEKIINGPINNFVINYGEPLAYKTNTDDNFVYIYKFDSIFDRDIFIKSFKSDYNNLDYRYRKYTTRNILLLYFFKDSYDKRLHEEISKLNNIFFEEFNSGIKKSYILESEHWKGTYNESYYDNSFKNKGGYIENDAYYRGKASISYITNNKSFNKIELHIYKGNTYAATGTSGNDVTCGFVDYDKAFNVKEDIKIIVSWNNKKEILKIIE